MKTNRNRRGGAVAAALAIAWLAAAAGTSSAQTAPQPLPGTPEKLGKVDFPVSCNAEAQRLVTRGLALYHSYHWPEARKSFAAASAADARCGMAHWGLAVVTLDNAFLWPLRGKALDEGLAHVERARAAGLPTQRERDYVAAAEAFYRNADKVPARTRQLAYELAMEKMTRDYPNDVEARVIHASVLSANFDPNDKTYSNQHRAADILEKLFVDNPDHPGVAHYLIHTYDYPPLASRGLAAAYKYREIAPSAPHALHMPSHIFTRLGLWKDSIASNASVLATTRDPRPRLHSLDYMIYAHVQLGEDSKARALHEEIAALRRIEGENFAAAYALAAVPARLLIERERWAEASKLTLHPGELDFAWQQFPHAEAINAFARGLGAARAGDAAATRAEIDRLRKLRENMLAATLNYWVGQADIQITTLEAWALVAERRNDEALATMRRAADMEDASEKNVVTPGPIKPARELLGEMQLMLGKPADALASFEKTLTVEPNRFRALLGAGQAAEAAGDRAKARAHYAQAVGLWQGADPDRREIARARQIVAAH